MNVKLNLESLEERSVPSATAIAAPVDIAPTAHFSTLPPTYSHPLAGYGAGNYSATTSAVDTGTTYHLSGSGHFRQIGNATVSGSIQSVGMIASGKAHGTLTFSNARGSVTVELTGPVQSGFSTPPTWFTYRVVSATGAYHSLKDHGTIRMALHTFASPGSHAVSPGLQVAKGSFQIFI
jgi:hypothetical protein